MAKLTHPMPYPLENLRKRQPEIPTIPKGDKTALAAGMAITIEPGAYLQGQGGVRIEDTVLVTPTGVEILTPTPKQLTVL